MVETGSQKLQLLSSELKLVEELRNANILVEKTSRQKLARYRLRHSVLHEPRGQARDRCWERKLGAAELSGVPRWVRPISLGALCPRTSQLAVPWNRNPVVQEGLHPHCDAGKQPMAAG